LENFVDLGPQLRQDIWEPIPNLYWPNIKKSGIEFLHFTGVKATEK
jgi:hypothetical protein